MKLIVFTDLDATLLDSVTYSWEAAREALEALQARQASTILVSSKTLAEMGPIHRKLGLADPFIVENGGGIALTPSSSITSELLARTTFPEPRSYMDYLLIALGTEYPELVAKLQEISFELGFPLTAFSAMSDAKVAGFTGLSPEQAADAKKRLFDEPFLLPDQAKSREREIRKAAAQKGLTAVEGGRFWHLIGHGGKGRAVSILIESYRQLYGEIYTLGLGDSPNDFPFLELVDTAVLVGGAKRFTSLPTKLQRARLTSISGPRGWNEEVLSWLAKLDCCRDSV